MASGKPFPAITVKRFGGGEIDLAAKAKPEAPFNWRLIVVYRGKHCPFCKKYLVELKRLAQEFRDEGVQVVAISADTEERAREQIPDIDPNYDVGFGLSVEQMQSLGLYISNPRSELESDRPFAEPGLFVVNHDGQTQVICVSNLAFTRPDLGEVLGGLKYIRAPGKNYPPRGTYRET